MILLPPTELRCRMDEQVMQRRYLHGLPDLASCNPQEPTPTLSRRGFLLAATAGLSAFALPARAADQLVFSPESAEAADEGFAPDSAMSIQQTPAAAAQTLRLGEIPPDFWLRPRELHLVRQGSSSPRRIVYWKDGKIQPEGYWQICALMRDVRANVMTTIDPALLDVLRGVLGYYEAWKWQKPLVITSGFRSHKTNAALQKEGAAKNSMHLYGRAADIYMNGVNPRDLGLLGMYMRHGGVGFYPNSGFTHLDTGKLRVWRG